MRTASIRRCVLAVSFGMLCAALLIPLQAQQVATVTGTVRDQAGKAVPGAAVEVRPEPAPGAPHTATADADGRYSIADLPAGVYTIEVSAPGFAKATRTGGQLNPGATLDIPITM